MEEKEVVIARKISHLLKLKEKHHGCFIGIPIRLKQKVPGKVPLLEAWSQEFVN